MSAAPPTSTCRFCGAEVPADTRYCLECGEGLQPYELLRNVKPGTVAEPAEAAVVEEAVVTQRRGTNWLIPALLVLLIAGGIVAYALTRDNGTTSAVSTATGPTTGSVVTSTVTTPTTASVPTASGTGSASVPTDTTTGTTPTESTATGTGTTSTGSTGGGSTPARPDDWSGTGYTVIVRSFPKATKTQQDAITYQQGLTGVSGSGVLDSDHYSSLKPGWWVVFVGKYSTADAAKAAAAKLRSSGQSGAYARFVQA